MNRRVVVTGIGMVSPLGIGTEATWAGLCAGRSGAGRITMAKDCSNATVVWNPWIAKARQMPDFGDEEYERMVCVESGNVASNSISLPPGGSSTLTVKLSSETLK